MKLLDDGEEWRQARQRLSSLSERLSKLMERTDLTEEARQQHIDELLRNYEKSE